ncbi:hypothetical protein CFC21_062067 [Triticum aestivum]|uniref:50S ribosomal protein L14, chloroplastic n=2 Tax=Triticum aestivum TaxID=4565 RepID=A0A9R1GWD7_WHEAT|nr:hypothetical protein CFC21_062067 [Triticum aestivum]
MIQAQTLFNVADNSGARKLMCIRLIVVAGNQRYACIGDIIVFVIKGALPQMPLERSKVIENVIIHTCKEFKCEDGIIIRYDDNAAVIIDQKGNKKELEFLMRLPRIERIEFYQNSFISP